MAQETPNGQVVGLATLTGDGLGYWDYTVNPAVFRVVSSNNPLPTGGGGTNGSTAGTTSSSTGFTNSSGNQTAVSPNTPFPVYSAGSTGTDQSANKPTLPNVGSNFAASGPYASYVLIKTIAAAPRIKIDIENISGAQIAVVRDDGTASNGSAPVNASVFAISGGSGAGVQGGSWASTTFNGRIQIYAASASAIVTVMVD